MAQGNNSTNDGNSTGSGNSTGGDTPKPPVKPPRFGYVELGIFIGLWVVMIVAFKLYTRSKKRKQQTWFGENEEKAEYERLLEEGTESEELLKKALVRRCMTDVRRLMSLQEERESVMSLGRSGVLSEEMLVSFKAAEQTLQLELFQVQAEAETFKAGWGESIIGESVRLTKIEDELMEVKRRKEREDRKKVEEEARKEKDKVRSDKLAVVEEQEKQKLLEELLREEEATATKDAAKVKKRVNVGGGKK